MPSTGETLERTAHPARDSLTSEALALGRVLIAAPDANLRLYVRRRLAGMASEIVEAADGLEALQRLAGRLAELVIADAEMPRLDGTELPTPRCHAPRSQSLHSHLKRPSH